MRNCTQRKLTTCFTHVACIVFFRLKQLIFVLPTHTLVYLHCLNLQHTGVLQLQSIHRLDGCSVEAGIGDAVKETPIECSGDVMATATIGHEYNILNMTLALNCEIIIYILGLFIGNNNWIRCLLRSSTELDQSTLDVNFLLHVSACVNLMQFGMLLQHTKKL